MGEERGMRWNPDYEYPIAAGVFLQEVANQSNGGVKKKSELGGV
jgi:hypothetical protein